MAVRKAIARLGELVLVLTLVSVGTFLLAEMIPGDPAASILGDGHTPEEYEQVREELGLNKPAPDRFWDWFSGAIRGDFGESLVPPRGEVIDRIAAAVPVSVEIALLGLVMALVVSIPLAMVAAYRPNGRLDRLISAGTFALISVPSFLVGMLLILVAVNGLDLFPRAQWVRLGDGLADNLRHAFLPALTVALMEVALFTRILRSDLITTLREDYILAAKAKGMPPWRVMVKDALRPSSLTLMTVAGLSLGTMIGSTVIAEYLFSLPGLGSLVVSAAEQGDLPMVQGAVLVIALVYVVVNAVIDVSYGLVDPRVRRARA